MRKIKELIKRILGVERIQKIKGFLAHCPYVIKKISNHDLGLEVFSDRVHIKSVLEAEGYHVYRGYYDIDYLDIEKNRFLCHRLPLNAENNRTTKCEVGFYNLNDLSFHKAADTNAWCWQQGSRLRWHPVLKDRILYNDASDGHYCCRVVNIDNDICEQVIDRALYDITPDLKYGLSLNYSRLQRLRPGYGYNYFEDVTKGENAPKNDGVFLVDIAANQSRLLYSLASLSEAVDPELRCAHYINHISVAPDGEHFIFFHIYVDPQVSGWKTVLYVSDLQGKKLSVLEKDDRVSHYCWLNNTTILVTCIHKESGSSQEYYCTYDVISGKKTRLSHAGLNKDGHPGRFPDSDVCITDTYPQVHDMNRQSVLMFSLNGKDVQKVASIYHDYRLVEEKRCDLHPSIGDGGNIISVDSTFRGGKRSVVLMEMESENGK